MLTTYRYFLFNRLSRKSSQLYRVTISQILQTQMPWKLAATFRGKMPKYEGQRFFMFLSLAFNFRWFPHIEYRHRRASYLCQCTYWINSDRKVCVKNFLFQNHYMLILSQRLISNRVGKYMVELRSIALWYHNVNYQLSVLKDLVVKL